MEHLIYVLGSEPEMMLAEMEGEQTTSNEDEALIFASKDEALSIIEGLSGGNSFWGTRPPRPR